LLEGEVPSGTEERSFRPAGLTQLQIIAPSVKTLGYYRCRIPKSAATSHASNFLRAGAGISAEGESPEGAGQAKDNGRGHDELKHERSGLAERLDQEPRRNVRDDHNRDNPPENDFEEPRENCVRVARDVQEIEVAVNQSLRAHDPKTDCGQTEHDRIMDRNAETDRDDIKQDRQRSGDVAEVGERDADNNAANHGVDHAVEPELFRGNGELAVNRQDEKRVELSSANQFRNGGYIDEKERLEKLRDHLVSSDEQNDFPFCPITDAVDIAENDGEKNDLADEPKHLHQHPKQEVRFETHLANEGVTKHDGVDLDVTPDHVLPVILIGAQVKSHLHEALSSSRRHLLDND
jgi:hypothetical protein